MHVDGGTISGFFVLPRAMLAASKTPGLEHGGIYLLYNGRADPAFEVVKPRTFAITGRALSTVLGKLDRNNIADMRSFAKTSGIAFSLCAIDDRFKQTSKTLFDPTYMRALYDFGFGLGAKRGDCLGGRVG